MKRQGNQSRRRKNGTGAPKGSRQMISHPGQLNGYQVTHSVKLRFAANAAFSGNITFQNLLDTWLLSTTAVAPFDVFSAVKVRKIEIWAIPILGLATTVTASFDGTVAGLVGDQAVHTDTSMGVQPAHIVCRPSMKSTASDYQISSVNSAFNLVVPTGAVVDVSLTFKQSFLIAPLAAQNASVGATVGAISLRGLDGLAVATTKFTTVGGTQI